MMVQRLPKERGEPNFLSSIYENSLLSKFSVLVIILAKMRFVKQKSTFWGFEAFFAEKKITIFRGVG